LHYLITEPLIVDDSAFQQAIGFVAKTLRRGGTAVISGDRIATRSALGDRNERIYSECIAYGVLFYGILIVGSNHHFV
jgi:hypothetical protein